MFRQFVKPQDMTVDVEVFNTWHMNAGTLCCPAIGGVLACEDRTLLDETRKSSMLQASRGVLKS